MVSKTAILIFAHTASEECNHKHFPRGNELFNALNQEVVIKVKKTGLPFFILTEKEQQGTTFGERYTNAIELVFKKGYSSVITVGNDTPELSSYQLEQAAANNAAFKITIGPTFDGGFYLLAINKSQFNKNDFLKLPWQKTSLRKELVKLLENNGTLISTFRFYNDLDNINDIRYYLTHSYVITSEIFNLLQFILVSKPNSLAWISVKSIFSSISFNKGSPKS